MSQLPISRKWDELTVVEKLDALSDWLDELQKMLAEVVDELLDKSDSSPSCPNCRSNNVAIVCMECMHAWRVKSGQIST